MFIFVDKHLLEIPEMRKKINYLLILVMSLTLFVGCKDGKTRTLTKATGTPYEVLLVATNPVLKSPAGRELKSVLESAVPALPQAEAQFRVSAIPTPQFDNIVKPVRNIMIVEVDSTMYTQPRFTFAKNVWSDGQMVLYLKAPTLKSLESFIPENSEVIINFFVNAELNRVVKVLQKNYNQKAAEELYDLLGVEMNIAGEINVSKKGENFYWISNNSNIERTDIVVYSVPYNDINAFQLENIIARRDSVMKENIPGAYPNSYMKTSSAFPPEYRTMNLGGKFVAEVRGLWEMEGDAMGGPFVSLTRLDEVNHRIITAEVFIFAPEKNKRNALRRTEASLYTLKLPKENTLPEVPITVEQNN